MLLKAKHSNNGCDWVVEQPWAREGGNGNRNPGWVAGVGFSEHVDRRRWYGWANRRQWRVWCDERLEDRALGLKTSWSVQTAV